MPLKGWIRHRGASPGIHPLTSPLHPRAGPWAVVALVREQAGLMWEGNDSPPSSLSGETAHPRSWESVPTGAFLGHWGVPGALSQNADRHPPCHRCLDSLEAPRGNEAAVQEVGRVGTSPELG